MNSKDTIKSLIYARTWLEKANAVNDLKQTVQAYNALMHNSPKTERITYGRKMVEAATRTNDDAVIGSAYLSFGALYYKLENHVKALDNYIIADEYISRTQDKYLIHKVKYTIGLTKMYLGFYEESLSILKECVAYYQSEDDRAYLASLHALGICYNRLENIEKSERTNQLGITFANEIGDTEMLPYFTHSQGIDSYFRKNYKEATLKLNEALHGIKGKNDIVTKTAAYFYLAKSYKALHQQDSTLKYLNKVDSAFVRHKYARPEFRKAFEMLINYYKARNNTTQELLYVNRLLLVDSVLTPNFKYLSGRIQKEYEKRDLIRSKKSLENVVDKMSDDRNVGIVVITGLSCVSILAIYLYVRTRCKYKRKFEQWRNQETKGFQVIESVNQEKDNEQDINPELEAAVLIGLEKFELNRRYKEKDMTLGKMAAALHSNSKYLSKIILKNRGRKFTDYMSEKRIQYVVEMLQKDSKWRNYTNEALGREAGFGSTQNFVRAFNTYMEMPPTFFVRELKKDLSNKNLP